VATSAELITGTTAWQGSLSSYDSQGNLSASTDGRGVTVSADGSSVTANAQATQYTAHQLYNAQGDQTAAGTPPITTTLNGVPNVNTAVTSTTGYDSDGNPTSSTTPNGNSTTMAYDHLGRQTSTTLPPVTLSTGQVVQPVQSTIYDGEDHLVRATDANNNSTLLSYDPLGRLVSSVNPVSGTTTNTYNATELIATQDPVGNTSHYQYDAAGRLTQVTDPLTGTALYQYDPAGNTTVITGGDTSGGVTQVQTQQYDSRNQVISATVTGPDGATAATQMGYDQDGNTTYQQAPNGDVTLSTYDRADRALSVQLVPTGGSTSGPQETYSYDASGNMTRAVDMDGRTSSMAYDGDARLTQGVDVVTAPTGTTTITTTPGYDPNGNALSQTTLTADSASPGVVTTHSQSATYNAADWIPSSSDDGLTTGYGYDAAGQQRSQSTSGSVGTVSQAFALDPQGRATAIGEGVAPYTSTFGYNANDAVINATLPGSLGAVQQSATYDANQRVRTVTATGYATGVLTTTLDNSYSYGYTPVGWTSGVTYVVNGVQSVQVITHNALGQVTAQSGYGDAPRGGAEQWSYDPSGNITQTLEPMAGSTQNVTTTYTYDPAAPNELQSQHTVGLGTASFGYDQRGNTTAISSTDPLTSQYAISTTLKYDAQGRPLTVTMLEQDPCAPRTSTSFLTSAVVFGYNAAGQRASYTVLPPAGCAPLSYSARYRYDGGGLLSEAAIISGTTTGTTSYTDTYLYDQGGNPLELVRAAVPTATGTRSMGGATWWL